MPKYRYTIRQWIGRVAVLVVILLAVGLRLHNLGEQSLWNDEGASVVMAHRTPGEIAANAAADIHPPGYYLLLSAWTKLAGESEFALRALSALESVLTVVLIYAVGRRLFGRGAGLIAALLLAMNTFAIYYAQETRMYAQLALLSTAGMWALAMWLQPTQEQRRGDRPVAPTNDLRAIRFALALMLINAAGLYTQYAYPFSMLAQGAIFVVWWLRRRDPRTLGLYVAANAGALLLFAPWIGTAIRQITTWPNAGTGSDPAQVIGILVFGLTAGEYAGWLAVSGAVALALGVLAGATGRSLLRWALPVLWTVIPVGAFLVLRLASDDLKSLLPAAGGVALWLGGGAANLWQVRYKFVGAQHVAPLQNRILLSFPLLAIVGGISVAVPLFAGLPALYGDPAYRRDDYRAMAARVAAEARPGDAVILDGPGQGEVWSYYHREGAPVYPLPRGLGGDDAATRAEVERVLRDHRRLFVLFWGEGERDPNHVVESMLNAQAFEVETQWYGDVRFVVYAAPGEAADAPTEIINVRFGEHIILVGYALDRESYRPGDALTLTLFWQTDTLLEARYKVFTHLYADPAAPPPAQHDSEPGGGLAPTTDWQPGETVLDRHGILIPPDLPPGEYTLAVGMYDAADPSARLETDEGERLPLAVIRVEP